MGNFYYYLKDFLLDKNIDLVILHNDLRWQHSLAIKLCNELDIKYLVTEQGLFRPNTTIVDASGVNANSNVKEVFLQSRLKIKKGNKDNHGAIDSYGHDSYKSYFFFLGYLLLANLGLLINTESKIVHKRHGIKEYFLRYLKSKSKSKKENKGTKLIGKKIIFVPLQLELDTQLLIHSDFNNNQEVIDLICESCFEANL